MKVFKTSEKYVIKVPIDGDHKQKEVTINLEVNHAAKSYDINSKRPDGSFLFKSQKDSPMGVAICRALSFAIGFADSRLKEVMKEEDENHS